MALTKVPASMLADTFATQANIDTAIAAEVTARNVAIAAIPAGAKVANRQAFTASGTWTKPTGFSANAMAFIQVWGGGGSGGKAGGTGSSGGGGGGSYSERWILLSLLGATETVTVGAGGASKTTIASGNVGGNSSFGSWNTAYGGGPGSCPSDVGGSGGGAGPFGAGGIQTPGAPLVLSSTPDGVAFYYIGQGCNTSGSPNVAGLSNHGGGGGYTSTFAAGGNATNGGGGGGGAGTGAGGISQNGGNGGASGTIGTVGAAPAGGGGSGGTGNSGAGGRGEVRITVFDGA